MKLASVECASEAEARLLEERPKWEHVPPLTKQ